MTPLPLNELSRESRAAEAPIVPDLPAAPGIRVAMLLSPSIGRHLRGLADALLVDEFPGSTLSRFDRELLATGVSAENGCFFCADSHAAHAKAVAGSDETSLLGLTEDAKACDTSRYSPKLRMLSKVALNVQNLVQDHTQEAQDVQQALEAGASSEDVQLTVAIAAAFSMYNRLVEGFRAPTPGDVRAYEERAQVIAENGYSL